jgi:hypothetical protein
MWLISGVVIELGQKKYEPLRMAENLFPSLLQQQGKTFWVV